MFLQHGHGLVVEHITALVEQAILAVAGIGIKGDIGHHAEFREVLFYLGDNLGHQAVRVVRFARIQAFQPGIYHREDRHRRYPQLQALLGIPEQKIQGLALHPWHGFYILDPIASLKNKNRIDEICRSEYMLSHQIP